MIHSAIHAQKMFKIKMLVNIFYVAPIRILIVLPFFKLLDAYIKTKNSLINSKLLDKMIILSNL